VILALDHWAERGVAAMPARSGPHCSDAGGVARGGDVVHVGVIEAGALFVALGIVAQLTDVRQVRVFDVGRWTLWPGAHGV
jgi:hypothetical protein